MSVELRALVSIGCAIAAAIIVLLAAGRFRVGGALAVLASFAAGSLVQIGEVPAFPTTDSTQVLLWAGLVAGALAAASCLAPRAGRLALLGIAPIVVVGAALRLLVGTSTFPTSGDAILWIAGWSAAGFGVSAVLDAWAARNEAGPAIALPLVVVAGGGGIALAADAGMKHGIQAASISAALGVSVVYSLWKSSSAVGRGALGVALSVLPGIWAAGHFSDDFPRGSSAVLMFAPLLAWLTEIPPLRARRPWIKGAVAAALALVPVAMVAIPPLMKAGSE